MIQVNCVKCAKPFEVADDRAGQNAACPNCGSLNMVAAPSRSAPPPPTAPSVVPPQATSAPPDKDALMWASLAHLAGLAVFIPFGNIVGPLIVWLTQKHKSPFVDHQGKEALNFQITVTLAMLVPLILFWVSTGRLAGVSMLIWLIIVLLDEVFVVQAVVSASKGRPFVYTPKIPLVK